MRSRTGAGTSASAMRSGISRTGPASGRPRTNVSRSVSAPGESLTMAPTVPPDPTRTARTVASIAA